MDRFPHDKKDPGLNPGETKDLSLAVALSSYFLQILHFPPTVHKHAC